MHDDHGKIGGMNKGGENGKSGENQRMAYLSTGTSRDRTRTSRNGGQRSTSFLGALISVVNITLNNVNIFHLI